MRARPSTAAVPAVVAPVVAGCIAVATLPVVTPGVVHSPGQIRVAVAALRAMFYVAAVATIGAHLRAAVAQRRRLPRQTAAWTGVLWLVLTLAMLMAQAAEVYPARAPTMSTLATYVADTASGKALLVVAALLAVLLVSTLVDVRSGGGVPAAVELCVGCCAVLILPLVGHAADHSGWRGRLGAVAMELHVLGAVVWTAGVLATLSGVLAGEGSKAAALLDSLSTLAGVCITVVAATGVCFAVLQLSMIPGVPWYAALLRGWYGPLLCAKVACILALAAVGGAMRYRVLPRIESGGLSGFVRLALLESTVMGMAFGLAAVLGRTPLS